MTKLPVIIGFGGISSAGRSSGFHAYRRTVLENLPASARDHTVRALAAMMGLVKHDGTGYVTMPNVDSVTEMVDLITAQRGYEANVQAMNTAKQMFVRTLDLLR